MAGYLTLDAFAGPYLQDQLLLQMALAGGGRFTSVKPSQHSLTAGDIIQRFLGVETAWTHQPDGVHLVELKRR
jgi:RNA 3'-terminal phosphate cyclase (ATP)